MKLMKKYSVHSKCKAIGGLSAYQPRTQKCILCGSSDVKKFKPTDENLAAIKEDIKRFPRTIQCAPEFKPMIDLINTRTGDFGCPGNVVGVNEGPVVTQFVFKPEKWVRVRKLKTLSEDLGMALSSESVTVTTLPKESAMSVCVANKTRRTITFAETLPHVIAHRDDMELPICLGVEPDGKPVVIDLTKMPHMLLAGSTGAGKSVGIANIIDSFLYIRSPRDLQFALVDPKTVELFPYKDIPHMWAGFKPESMVLRAIQLMRSLDDEMRRRMSLFHSAKVKNIQDYNAKVKSDAEAYDNAPKNETPQQYAVRMEAKRQRESDHLPYIVLVIDEMADLVMQEKKLFIEVLATLAQMARAAGIHIIAATQRPSVDIIKGAIKVNFPARVAFKVPSHSDSKTVIDSKGAEKLLGYGDMFFKDPSAAGPLRVHGPLVTKADTARLMAKSIEFGHHNTVPADHMDEGVATGTASENSPAFNAVIPIKKRLSR